MGKNYQEKEKIAEIKEKALRLALKELKVLNKKREKELEDLDKTAKMLIRRDLELQETREKREKELEELEKSKEALTKTLKDVKKARSNAEEEKNKTLAIITNFTDGLLVFNIENRLLLINPKAEEFLRIRGSDVIGKSIKELLKIDFLKPLFFFRDENLETKELKIGEDLVFEIKVIPLVRENKEKGTLMILHDITRGKIIERTKNEFVSLAAHQLRTPLSVIKWILAIILNGELGEITEKQKEFLQDGYNSNQKMINLVNTLLNVARIEEGRYVYDLTLTSVEKFVNPVISSFKGICKKNNIHFVFKKPPNPLPNVLVDVDKIRIVLENIIGNAVAYTSPKGEITVSLKYSKKEIEISVRDTGMGIPKKQQENIFKKFFRAANVIKKETEGTGLGLFISKNIIEAHNGKIWFESEEGEGTVFHFTIPVKNSNIK